MRETVLIILIILAIVCFFKTGLCIDENKPYAILYLAGLVFMCGISIVCNFILIRQNNELTEKVKGKCPEYEQINNVYILKK